MLVTYVETMEISQIVFLVMALLVGVFALATLLTELDLAIPLSRQDITTLKPNSISWLAGIATILAVGILLIAH